MTRRLLLFAVVLVALLFTPSEADATPLRVGSKRFPESFILAEIVVAIARSEGIDVVHEQGLGSTALTYRALVDGAIDVYPEYTGTIAETIVKNGSASIPRLSEALAPKGLAISEPIGFENTYGLATTKAIAARDHLAKMSDLAAHPSLRFGLSHELLGRNDGWTGLAARYGLEGVRPSAIDHGLAYDALQGGSIDVTEVYTTDAKIARFDLVLLEDDRHFFPPYEAVLFYRADTVQRFPAFARVLERMKGSIDTRAMQRLNARAEIDHVAFPRIAAEFLGTDVATQSGGLAAGMLRSVRRHGPRHMGLAFGALLLSTVIGVPLGILAFARRRLGVVVLGLTSAIQTIPSLALFCFFIPLLGIGPVPALVALFLYGLLPIVRNTHAGLTSIPEDLRDAAEALGLSTGEKLRHVELPLASRTILAGIKTSAVVAVGSATIAAFIGAGGFGEPISTGLSLNDVPTILEGAIPAAVLALVVQGGFALVERALVPEGLKGKRG